MFISKHFSTLRNRRRWIYALPHLLLGLASFFSGFYHRYIRESTKREASVFAIDLDFYLYR